MYIDRTDEGTTVAMKAKGRVRRYLLSVKIPTGFCYKTRGKRPGQLSSGRNSGGGSHGAGLWQKQRGCQGVPALRPGPAVCGSRGRLLLRPGTAPRAAQPCGRWDTSEGARCDTPRPHACGRCGADRPPPTAAARGKPRGAVRGRTPGWQAAVGGGGAGGFGLATGEATGQMNRSQTPAPSLVRRVPTDRSSAPRRSAPPRSPRAPAGDAAGKGVGAARAQRGVRSRRPTPLPSAGMRACLAHAHCARSGRAHSAALRLRAAPPVSTGGGNGRGAASPRAPLPAEEAGGGALPSGALRARRQFEVWSRLRALRAGRCAERRGAGGTAQGAAAERGARPETRRRSAASCPPRARKGVGRGAEFSGVWSATARWGPACGVATQNSEMVSWCAAERLLLPQGCFRLVIILKTEACV